MDASELAIGCKKKNANRILYIQISHCLKKENLKLTLKGNPNELSVKISYFYLNRISIQIILQCSSSISGNCCMFLDGVVRNSFDSLLTEHANPFSSSLFLKNVWISRYIPSFCFISRIYIRIFRPSACFAKSIAEFR